MNRRSKTRLLNTYQGVATHSLEDLIYVMAINVEDAMITGGAIPGRDYKILDLYKLAMPLAQDLFKTNDKVDFVTGYPAGHPGSSSFDPDDID